MKTQLSTLEVSLHLTATEREARVLNLIASYVRADAFTKHFTQQLPRGVTADDFDAVMAHLHTHLGGVLHALDAGRAKIADDLRGR